jgi:hypothetical protein
VTTLHGIQTGNDPNLPPLMNPAMLEASDDLTNLSHLNEPAGMDDMHTHPVLWHADALQSSRPSSCGTCRRRSTHTRALS